MFRNALSVSGNDFHYHPTRNLTTTVPPKRSDSYSYAVREHVQGVTTHPHHHAPRASPLVLISAVSVLIPDWEVLIIVSLETPLYPLPGEDYRCLFQNNATSPARFSGTLPFTNRATFKCVMPNSVRRLRPFFQPLILKKSTQNESPVTTTTMTTELYRWTFLVYESLSTEDDVVLFVKGVNQRQGINRSPSEFRCVFSDSSNNISVKTAVTSSVQEVFRCPHPNTTAFSGDDKRIKISLEMVNENRVVPSAAYYAPRSSVATTAGQPKSLLCACTMAYNVAKVLKEWVMYHSKIGVDKFILYDNDSGDDVERVVRELNAEGYDVSRLFWMWPKTQEAGFSHSALYAKESCTWMMYVDVDEFVFSPAWGDSSLEPSHHNLKSLLPQVPPTPSPSSSLQWPTGQVLINCNEFGPSNQRTHPAEGVTQGYTCRRRLEQRHKSIVLLDAVDRSLLNVIHHFELRNGYRSEQMSMDTGVVNHYKYQAWPEFQTKFRRRVSAYVVDWKEAVNPQSKDRTPGLGFRPIEPKDWADMFCEVRDERLKLFTQRWFGSNTPNGYKMLWQS